MFQIVLSNRLLLLKHLIISLFCVLLSVCNLLPAQAGSETAPSRIQSVLYNAATNSLNLVAQPGAHYGEEYTVVKFSSPDRAVIDIPNAYLGTPTRNLPVHQNGIDHIELSQTLGTFYQVVRVTVFASQEDVLNALKIQPRSNTLSMTFAPVQEARQTQPPLPAQLPRFNPPSTATAAASGLNVIQSATFENGSLRVAASNGNALVVKNQFTLSAPSRLVIDFGNAVLASKALTRPMDVNNGLIRNIRLGQFDDSTVRIVVETPRPNGIYLVYPGEDKSLVALTTSLTQSIRTLPRENQRVGYIQDINLSKRDDDASVLKISTSDPMVKRLVRHGNQIELELLNIAAKPSFVGFDNQAFSEIKEIRLSPLNADEPNTKLIIKLDDANVEMDNHLSLDGRTLEISFSPRGTPYQARGHKLPTLITPNGVQQEDNSVPTVRRGAYTVVVDAGHGGKDLGANREGVYEKYLNLSVALKVKQALEARGVTVHMTRNTDKFLELSQITGITNRIRPDAFVSVHTNASVNATARGLETYYFTPQSRDLAQRVHRRMVNSIPSPDRGVRTARFYVVHHTTVPAILCEMGYISNPQERSELQSEARQRATAEAIAQGVVEFLGRHYKADASEGDEF